MMVMVMTTYQFAIWDAAFFSLRPADMQVTFTPQPDDTRDNDYTTIYIFDILLA